MEQLLEWLIIFTPIVFGIVMAAFRFNNLPTYGKLIFYQLIAGFCIELSGQLSKKLPVFNGTMFNVYMLPDFLLLLFAGCLLIQYKKWKQIALPVAIAYCLFWVYQTVANGWSQLHENVIVFEGILLAVLYIIALYRQSFLTKESIINQPFFWICLGHIVFYGCIIPHFSVWHSFVQLNVKLANKVYGIIHILSLIRYVCVGVAFTLLYRQTLPSYQYGYASGNNS